MNPTRQETTWRGMRALALENELLRTLVVPDMGAKLVSLLDKRNQVEWLVGPGARPFRPVPYGAPFTEQDMSGWDEMFPTISACAYPVPGELAGRTLPDHGEVWALPWAVSEGQEGRLTLAVTGRALPYRLVRTLAYPAPDTLALHYRLTNTGREALAYIWAAHPQFATAPAARVRLPARVNRVWNTLPEAWGWGPPETEYAWPEATTPQGNPVRLDEVGPPSLQRARKFFLPPELRIEMVTLVRQPGGAWLQMAWSPADIPYFGLWVDEGALSPTSVVTPEPTTGFYDSLETAWQKREVTVAGPGETKSWTVTVTLGMGNGATVPEV